MLFRSVRFNNSGGDEFIDLAWAPTDAYTPTGYKLESRVVGGSWVTVSENLGATTAYRLSGLVNGTAYEIRVTPITAAGGVNSFGTATSTILVPQSAASAPTALSATVDNAQSTLTWTAPADAGGGTIIGYEIEQSADNSTWTVLTANTGSTDTTYTATGLSNGTRVYFRVSAVTNLNANGATVVVSVVPTLPGRAPLALNAVPGNGIATLSWAQPQIDDAADAIGYRIEEIGRAHV